MKYGFFLWTGVLALLAGAGSCQTPEPFRPDMDRQAITNLIASFPDDERDANRFESEIDYENHRITVVFPYNYPPLSDQVLTLSDLCRMRVQAILENNAYVTPKLLFLDLSRESLLTVTAQDGTKAVYTVAAEIRKSAECRLTAFSLPGAQLTGIINDNAGTVSIVTIGDVSGLLAEISLSHGAVIEPDPRVEKLDYNKDVTLTVIAQNGVDKKVYTVRKEVPPKLAAGLRKSSPTLLWAKKLDADLGVKAKNMTTGIAATRDYLIVNTRAEKPLFLDARTGEVKGRLEIDFAGSVTNFYVTADDGDHILFSNLTPNGGPEFLIRKTKGLGGPVETFIRFQTALPLGRKFSVIGDLDGDALITAPVYAAGGRFLRWQVTGGRLRSAVPDEACAVGVADWRYNADVIHTDPADPASDFLACYYSEPRHFSLFDGRTGALKAAGPDISPNWVQNAVDYAVFNKVGYAIANSVNSFSWGQDDCLYLYDLSGGTLGVRPIDFGPDGLDINGNYGGKALGAVNANSCGDVALKVSEDGYYLYIYFMFDNGYVGCVQCDCIDM